MFCEEAKNRMRSARAQNAAVFLPEARRLCLELSKHEDFRSAVIELRIDHRLNEWYLDADGENLPQELYEGLHAFIGEFGVLMLPHVLLGYRNGACLVDTHEFDEQPLL